MAATSLSSRPHASVYNVPAFASGLGMTLEPIKTAGAAAAGAGATSATTTTAVTLEKVSEREIFQDLLPSFSNSSSMFLNPDNFSNLNYNCSNLLDMINLQEQVKKAFCYQKLF